MLESVGMQLHSKLFCRTWQVTFAMALMMSHALLLAHAHEQDPGRAQVASCLICIAAQHPSPACTNSFPQIDTDVGHSPFIAEADSALCSAAAPITRQRSPPAIT
ncbi:MAG: hypothetical protein L0Y45_00100 [Woeseiaceae bacterium]|nr:hypothetical protein [Woeseiaceae bacterium]